MNEWIKKNQEKVIYGLAILAVILLIAMFSTKSSMSEEIDRLSKANSALESDSAAKDKTIGEEREKLEELTGNLDSAKTEAAKLSSEVAGLTAANAEFSDKIKSLEESLSEARIEIDRLEFVALLRQKNADNLKNEVDVLKRAEAGLEETITALRREAESADARVKELEDTVKSLGGVTQ